MSRQRLTIGTFGEIGYLKSSNGRTVARARYRDWDGKSRTERKSGRFAGRVWLPWEALWRHGL